MCWVLDKVKRSHLDFEFQALQDAFLKRLEGQGGMCGLPHIHAAVNGREVQVLPQGRRAGQLCLEAELELPSVDKAEFTLDTFIQLHLRGREQSCLLSQWGQGLSHVGEKTLWQMMLMS